MGVYQSKFLMSVEASDKTKGVLTNLQNNIAKVEKKGKSTGAAVGTSFTKMAGAFVAAQVAIAAVEQVFSQLATGKEDLTVGAAFGSIVENADAVLERMNKISGHKIENTSLQKLVIGWQQAGKDIKVLEDTLPIAYKVAAATGQQYIDVAEEIAHSLERGKKGALVKYVGVVDEAKAYEIYAASVNKSVKAFSSLDKKAAISQEQLRLLQERYGNIEIDVNAASIDEAKKAWDDLLSDMSGGFAKLVGTGITAIREAQAGLAEDDRRGIKTRAGANDELLARAERRFNAGTLEGDRGFDEMVGAVATLKDELNDPTIWGRLHDIDVAFSRVAASERDTAKQGILVAMEMEKTIDALEASGRVQSDEAAALRDWVLEQARGGASANQVWNNLLGTLGAIVKVRKDAIALDSTNKVNTEAAAVRALREAEAARVATIEAGARVIGEYWAARSEQQEIEGKAEGKLNLLEQAKLALLDLQIAKLRESRDLSLGTLALIEAQLAGGKLGELIGKGVGAYNEGKGSFVAMLDAEAKKRSKKAGGGSSSKALSSYEKGGLMIDIGEARGELTQIEAIQARLALELKDIENTYTKASDVLLKSADARLKAEQKIKEVQDARQASALSRIQAVVDAEQADEEAKQQGYLAELQHQATMIELDSRRTESEKLAVQMRLELAELENRAKLGQVEDYEREAARIKEVYAARIAAAEAKNAPASRLERAVQEMKDAADVLTQVGQFNGGSLSAGFTGASVAVSGISAALGQYSKDLKESKQNTLATGASIAASMLAGAAASEKSEKRKAAMYGAMEVANGLAAVARKDYYEAAAHGVAAAAYFAIALTSGGGAAKPKTVYRAPAAATTTSASERGGNTYNYHVQGIMAGTTREFAQEAARILNANKGLIYLDEGLMSKQAGGL